jgi:hypothetical protein
MYEKCTYVKKMHGSDKKVLLYSKNVKDIKKNVYLNKKSSKKLSKTIIIVQIGL